MTHYASTRFAPEIEPHELRWLWPTRIPLGSVTVLAGDPGVGKSLLAAHIAAHVSTARQWPDNQTCAPWPEPTSPGFSGGIIYLSAEDHPAAVLIPRLKRAGADPDRINILDGVIDAITYRAQVQELKRKRAKEDGVCFPDPLPPLAPDTCHLTRASNKEPLPLTLPTHANALAQAIRSISHPRLLVIDTLPAILDPGPVSLASVMRILNDLAYEYHICILAIMHLAKTRTHRPIYRVRGSLTYTASARTVLLVTTDPDDQDKRTLLTLKSVYARPAPPLAFRIASHAEGHVVARPSGTPLGRVARDELDAGCHADGSCVGMSSPEGHDHAGVIQWDTAVEGSDLSSPSSRSLPAGAGRSVASSLDSIDLTADNQSALFDAMDYLAREMINGPRPARELFRRAKAMGLYPITLRRAKRALKVLSTFDGKDRTWHWSLPTASDRTAAQEPQRRGDQKLCQSADPP